MQDHSFWLAPALFAPVAPFRYAFVPEPPWRWVIKDGVSTTVATAKTRAGARAAVRALYGGLTAMGAA